MSVLRGLIGVLVGLAVTVGFVQFLEADGSPTQLPDAPLQSMADYALVLNSLPLLALRLAVTSLVALLGGYLCAKVAERDEMRYTLIAVIFRLIALVAGNAAGYIPPTPPWALAVLLTVSTATMLAAGPYRGCGRGHRAKESRRKHLRLAYQGEPGAYSEAAALVYGGPQVETVPCKSFDDVFEAVVKKRATHGVVPLENSIGGTIHRNYDLLLEHELMITGEVELDVVHCLLALPGTTISDVKVVYSHPQALAQCERYLKDLGVTVEAGVRHGRRREARRRAEADECRRARLAPRGRSVRSRGAAGGRAGLRIQHHAVRDYRRRRRRRCRQDDDRLCAAQHARRALQGAQRVSRCATST